MSLNTAEIIFVVCHKKDMNIIEQIKDNIHTFINEVKTDIKHNHSLVNEYKYLSFDDLVIIGINELLLPTEQIHWTWIKHHQQFNNSYELLIPTISNSYIIKNDKIIDIKYDAFKNEIMHELQLF